MKTVEELTSELEAQRVENEAMNAKNRQLLDDMKKVKKQISEVDLDAYHKALDRVDALESENSKLSGELKLKAKDSEKLLSQLGEKDGALSNLLIENGLVTALTTAGVKPELMKYVKDSLKSQTKLVNDNGEFKAMIGDKSLNDFVTEWKDGDGLHVISAPQSSGGGSSGTKQGGETSVDLSKMSASEMMKMGRSQSK
jgi:hypothetical protein